MSPEMQNLLKAALAVAISAPPKPKPYQYLYHVPATFVTDLRDAFEAMGVDWRELKARAEAAQNFRAELEEIAK